MIKIKTEIRGKKEISTKIYIVPISSKMIDECLDFATKIVIDNNQYSRLLPENISLSCDLKLQEKLEIQRTFVGKLGECAFAELLKQKFGITPDLTEMFAIYDGQENVDNFDFITCNKETIDIKTGFRFNHKNLLINIEQFDKLPKDYYVAVKLNATDIDFKNKLIDFSNINSAEILGFADHNFLTKYAKTHNFGEGDARYWPYNQLMGIDVLIKKL